MKHLILLMIIAVATLSTKAQSAFDNQSQVQASDGTSYEVIPLGPSANKVRVSNKANVLHNTVRNYPNVVSETFRRADLYDDWLISDLNRAFSKQELLAFTKDQAPIRIFAIHDQAGVIREVNFYLPKSTAINVNQLRQLEKIIKTYIVKYEKQPPPSSDGRPQRWILGLPSFFPEFNGMPYYAVTMFMDFVNAYKAIRNPRPSIPEREWILP